MAGAAPHHKIARLMGTRVPNLASCGMRTHDSLRLCLLCCLGGLALAAALSGGLMATNLGHIGAALRGADVAPLPVLLLSLLGGLGFAAGRGRTALARSVNLRR
jgi:hypothetical protein